MAVAMLEGPLSRSLTSIATTWNAYAVFGVRPTTVALVRLRLLTVTGVNAVEPAGAMNTRCATTWGVGLGCQVNATWVGPAAEAVSPTGGKKGSRPSSDTPGTVISRPEVSTPRTWNSYVSPGTRPVMVVA